MSTVSKATVILPNLTGHCGWSNLRRIRSQCSDPSSKRGFSPRDGQDPKKKRNSSAEQKKVANLRQRKLTTRQFGPFPGSPGLSASPGKSPGNDLSDLVFEERLKAARRSALKQKKAEEEKELGAIDYDAPIETKQSTAGIGTKVGVGVAVLVFGLVFAVGDFLPSGSVSSNENAKVTTTKLSQEERAVLETRLKQFQATLGSSPKDPVTLEGAAVTLVKLGEYTQAANLLNDLTKEKPNDPDVFRLLGEVKYELRDYEASATAYKKSLKATSFVDFEVLRGLTDALLAAEKPDEAVQALLEARDRLIMERVNDQTTTVESGMDEKQMEKADAIPVELLLGKAYSAWGHISDAVSVYDQLISRHPNDFRGYLAKGIVLKENGNPGDAERMFIQARFFAPDKAKMLVDRYSRR